MSGASFTFQKKIYDFWMRYKRNKSAVIGLFIIAFYISLAILAPYITTYSPTDLLVGDPFEDPTPKHIMGTDDLGRDIFSGVAYGARVTLFISFLAVSLSAIIGMLVGGIAGYYSGLVDDILMRIAEIFMAIPRLVLALVLVALFGPSLFNIVIVVGFLSWPNTARIVRAEFLSLKEREFILAAECMGVPKKDIIFREMLPNASSPFIVSTTLTFAAAILIESGLSFLGCGDPNLPSWGYMLKNAQAFLWRSWPMAFFPGIAIFFTTLSLNLIGDGLNDVLNVKLREV